MILPAQEGEEERDALLLTVQGCSRVIPWVRVSLTFC